MDIIHSHFGDLHDTVEKLVKAAGPPPPAPPPTPPPPPASPPVVAAVVPATSSPPPAGSPGPVSGTPGIASGPPTPAPASQLTSSAPPDGGQVVKGRSKGKNRPYQPPTTHLWLFISNRMNQAGRRTYQAYGGNWSKHLGSLLPSHSRLLEGATVVSTSKDTRLTLACTSREYRAALLTALHATSSVHASPFLSVEEREGKKFTY